MKEGFMVRKSDGIRALSRLLVSLLSLVSTAGCANGGVRTGREEAVASVGEAVTGSQDAGDASADAGQIGRQSSPAGRVRERSFSNHSAAGLGSPTTLASGQDVSLDNIAVDSTSVYWLVVNVGTVIPPTPK
jgi:hypothetical protein